MAGREAAVSIAAVNGPQNTVISGRTRPWSTRCCARSTADGVEAQRLNVSHAFHSPLMDPMLDGFEAVAATVQFVAAAHRLVSNVTGRLAGDEIGRRPTGAHHLREAVRFADSIATLQRDGYRVFVEVGPAPTLLGMAQRCAGRRGSPLDRSLRKGQDDAAAMLESLGQLMCSASRYDWSAVLGDGAAAAPSTLPSYPFQRERTGTARAARAGAALAPTAQPASAAGRLRRQSAARSSRASSA